MQQHPEMAGATSSFGGLQGHGREKETLFQNEWPELPAPLVVCKATATQKCNHFHSNYAMPGLPAPKWSVRPRQPLSLSVTPLNQEVALSQGHLPRFRRGVGKQGGRKSRHLFVAPRVLASSQSINKLATSHPQPLRHKH